MKTTILILLFASLQLSAQFTLFTPENSDLPSTNITDMVVDYENRLWIATDTGLVVFENDIWTTFNTNNSNLRTNYIQDLYLDNSGNFYVLNQNTVFLYNNNTFEIFLDNISATTIAIDNQQRLLSSNFSALIRYNSGKVDTLVKTAKVNGRAIGDLKIDQFNNIYFRREFSDGFSFIDNEDKIIDFTEDQSSNLISVIEDMSIDSNNNLWLSNYKNMYYYNAMNSTIERYDKEDSDILNTNLTLRKVEVNTNNTPYTAGSYTIPRNAYLIFFFNGEVYSHSFEEYFDTEIFEMDINAMAIDLDDNVWIHITEVGLLKFDPSLASIEQIPNTDYTIYPNPATSQISVDLEEGLVVSNYKIIDKVGRVVLSDFGGFTSTQTIDVQQLPVGAYIIELTTTSGELVRDKFVKR